jgi:hypothetical protein
MDWLRQIVGILLDSLIERLFVPFLKAAPLLLSTVTFVVGNSASASSYQAANPTSRSQDVLEARAGFNARANAGGIGENVFSLYELTSDDAVAARTVGHHTIPKAIQKQLPPSVRNHPDVVGRAGNPNVRQIPEATYGRVHSSPPGNYYPGGDYNRRFDQLIRERGGYDAVSPRDVTQIRDQLVREFGL